MIGLPRSTYFRRPRVGAEDAEGPDAILRAAITAVRTDFPAYGYRRVTHELRRHGVAVNHKRVQRLMRDLVGPPLPRRRPWMAIEPDAIAGAWYPNLAPDFAPTGPDQLWVADLTYVWVAREFAYVAVILDA